ncbi:MAG: hypothetical protein MJA29_02135, partial [Candidatus Omnitrophica bacterium]|nr:hypothetical protein [Candidatus Omnitrophota bacterium]
GVSESFQCFFCVFLWIQNGKQENLLVLGLFNLLIIFRVKHCLVLGLPHTCSYQDLGTLLFAGLQKISIDSLECSSPRKSLVKGERFMRGIEEKPE